MIIEKLLLLIICLTILGIFLGWGIIRVSKNESLLNKRFDDLELKAKNAETLEEIKAALEKLIELDNDSWHKLHGSRLTVIKTILQLKYNSIAAKKIQFDFDL